MNLICFPHYTCGGLLCDIFQDTFSKVGGHGGILSISHSVGKIGDSSEIFDTYDPDDFLHKLEQIKIDQNSWVGTHCWPGLLTNFSQFEQIILVTTTTYRSRFYRWSRAYHHYYSKSEPWQTVSGVERIDKERETAKNYIKPFLPVNRPNIINIEFAEIVENSVQFKKLVKNYSPTKHLDRWQQINNFLYDSDIWNSNATKRFYEAELEVNLKQPYVYE